MENDENAKSPQPQPQVLVLSRNDLIAIFTEWKKRAVEGEWEKVSDGEIDPTRSADTLIEIAFQL